MSFPQVAATSNGNSGATGTTHVVTLPTGISSGDLLLVFFANQQGAADAPAITTPASGWVQLFTKNQGSGQNLTVFYRWADGNEAATITITIAGNRSSAYACYRVTGADSGINPESGTAAGATSTAPNPPTQTVSWGSADNLWIVTYAWRGNVAHATYPANYISNQLTDRWVNTLGCGIAVATQNIAAATEDPGVAAIGTSTIWAANTVVVKPAGGAATYTGTSSLAVGSTALSSSASFTKPSYSGTVSLNKSTSLLSSNATFIKPTYIGTASLVHVDPGMGTQYAATLSASSKFTKPIYIGTGLFSSRSATLESSGIFVRPTYSGIASFTVSNAVLSASATFLDTFLPSSKDYITLQGEIDISWSSNASLDLNVFQQSSLDQSGVGSASFQQVVSVGSERTSSLSFQADL